MIDHITASQKLKNEIAVLTVRQAHEWPLLKVQFLETYESLKPLNVIKTTYREVTASPDFKNNVLGHTVGLTAGLITKAIVLSVSKNPINKIFGTMLQLGISNLVSKNPEKIKSLAGNIIELFSSKNMLKVKTDG